MDGWEKLIKTTIKGSQSQGESVFRIIEIAFYGRRARPQYVGVTSGVPRLQVS
jgi:hypothetical protein